MLEIKPIFQALSDPELLKKCLKGKSQNPNKSLNNAIWARLPKRTFVAIDTLKFGVYEAVLSYNDGYFSKVKMMKELGLSAGVNLAKAMKRLDEERIRKAEKALLEFEKKVQQSRTLIKRKIEDLFQQQEDTYNPSYSVGHY